MRRAFYVPVADISANDGRLESRPTRESTTMLRTPVATIALGMFVIVAAAPAQADVPAEATCKEAKANATGRKVADILRAFGRNMKKPDLAKLVRDVSKAESKFTRCFSKAKATGGCLTSGGADRIEAKVNAFLEEVTAEVSGLTTTTATTAILPSSSSITSTTNGPGTTTTTVLSPCGTDSACVFLTSQTWNGALNGLAGADAKCRNAARNGVPWLMGKDFRAWLSDQSTSASMRLSYSAVPYRLAEGTLVAADWDDLVDGELTHPIDMTELSTPPLGTYHVWTGTNTDGTTFAPLFPPSSLCENWTVQWWETLIGDASKQDEDWTAFYRAVGDENMCGHQYRLYCFQQ